jgi:hypothetical protein
MQRPSASIRSADERALSTSLLATFTCSVAELPAEPELASRLRRILVDDGIEHVDARAVAVDQIGYRRGCWRERSSRRAIRFSKPTSSVGRPGWPPPGVGR